MRESELGRMVVDALLDDPVLRHLPASMWDCAAAVQEALPQRSGVFLITRHSQRDSGHLHGHVGYDLPLTLQGERLAQAWGHRLTAILNRPLSMAQSSPVPRCLETARLMGAQAVVDEPLWFDQTSLVYDLTQAAPTFGVHGAARFLTKLLQEEVAGAYTPHQIARRLLAQCLQSYPALTGKCGPSLGLIVTHDLVLVVLVAVMLGRKRVFEDDWPQMMEGAFLWFTGPSFEARPVSGEPNDDRVHVVWRGQKTTHALTQWAD